MTLETTDEAPTEATSIPERQIEKIIKHFTPNWFAATMGTGILGICLSQFPSLPPVYFAGQALWVLNIGLFTVFSAAYLLKWLLYPQHATQVFQHSVVSMFFGCIPMGLATIINGFIIFGPAHFGDLAYAIAARLWIFDAALSMVIGLAIPFMMFTRQEHAINTMSSVWLLPIVAAEVAAASGALLLPHIPLANEQLVVLLACYVLWASSVPLALGILVILFLRLVLHKLPPADMAATSWLALGPIGTGALCLVLLSNNAGPVLQANGLGALVDIFAGASLIGATLLWAYGLWWLAMAVAMTWHYLRRGAPFNLGWWGYTFPLGVYSASTVKLGERFQDPVIPIIGVVLIASLAAIWLVVASRTLRGALNGSLFNDPSLKPAP